LWIWGLVLFEGSGGFLRYIIPFHAITLQTPYTSLSFLSHFFISHFAPYKEW
jgi:hypothetical protein